MESQFAMGELIPHNYSVVVRGAGSGVFELTNSSRLGIREVGLKETGGKTVHFRQRGNTELQHWTV